MRTSCDCRAAFVLSNGPQSVDFKQDLCKNILFATIRPVRQTKLAFTLLNIFKLLHYNSDHK